MTERQSVLIVDQEGRQGRVVEVIERPNELGQLLILLDNGQEALVPMDLVTRQADDTYYSALRFSELQQAAARTEAAEHVSIPVITEQATVQRRVRETGRVRLTKVVHEEQKTVDEPIIHEEVKVERVPVNRMVEGPVESHYEGDTLVVPLLEEVLVVEKRLMLKEELRITKQRVEQRHPQTVALRREEVQVERIDANPK